MMNNKKDINKLEEVQIFHQLGDLVHVRRKVKRKRGVSKRKIIYYEEGPGIVIKIEKVDSVRLSVNIFGMMYWC